MSNFLEDQQDQDGFIRTDMYCHDCSKNFVAQLDGNLDGNHEIECPHCAHIHYRVVKNGQVTNDRYDTDLSTHKVERRNMWKSSTQPIQTSTASSFLRQKWLDKMAG